LTDYTFIDTNILLYAHDRHDERRSSIAQTILRDLWESDTGVLSTQVLQEFYSVATKKLKHPLPKPVARKIVADYGEWCLINTDPLLIVSASKLEEDHTINFWDALIVESALRANATKLLSEDLQNGQKFGNLVIENPFA
jgi:predicted nucleic acid-binding protein